MATTEDYIEIGNILRDKRSAMGLTLSEVSRILKIRAIYLQAIEEGKVDELPAQVYISHYIKAYAEFMGDMQPALDRVSIHETRSPQLTGLKKFSHVELAPPVGAVAFSAIGLLMVYATLFIQY